MMCARPKKEAVAVDLCLCAAKGVGVGLFVGCTEGGHSDPVMKCSMTQDDASLFMCAPSTVWTPPNCQPFRPCTTMIHPIASLGCQCVRAQWERV